MPTEEQVTVTQEDLDWYENMINLLDAANERAADKREHDAEVQECCGGKDKWCGHWGANR